MTWDDLWGYDPGGYDLGGYDLGGFCPGGFSLVIVWPVRPQVQLLHLCDNRQVIRSRPSFPLSQPTHERLRICHFLSQSGIKLQDNFERYNHHTYMYF